MRILYAAALGAVGGGAAGILLGFLGKIGCGIPLMMQILLGGMAGVLFQAVFLYNNTT